MSRLKEKYVQQIIPALASKLDRKNIQSLPAISKIVVSMGVGTAIQDKKHLELAVSGLTEVTGQKPIVSKAKKSVSGFRLREDMPIGCKVTLRRQRMYEFMDRLISVALPRVRDFRGISTSAFDGHGNYSLGISENLVFPELNPDKYLVKQGMNITFVVRNASDSDSRLLLEMFGLPFKRQAEEAALK